MTTNDEQQTGNELTEQERAEYAELERQEAQRQQDELNDPSEKTPDELHQGDAEAEEAFPVENGAVKWEDAANEGDTSREKQAVYDTPWGRRELSATEVQDFAAQGVPVTRVDDEPRTSLAAEKDEMSKITLTGTPIEEDTGAVPPQHDPFA